MTRSWKDIKASEINWFSIPGVSVRAARLVSRFCITPIDSNDADKHPFDGLTLGQIAEMGELNWRRFPALGAKSVKAIKLAIDYAAAGRAITGHPPAPGYTPQPIPGSEATP